jgi:RNA polymerase-binding protein DksA
MGHLTREQTARIEQLLRGRQRALRGEIREGLLRSDEAHHKDLAGMVSDEGDEAVANMLADVDVAAIDRDVRELREVEDALARIGREDFGACADCGDPIDFARLQANPGAVRCITCQTRWERGHAHGGTPTL